MTTIEDSLMPLDQVSGTSTATGDPSRSKQLQRSTLEQSLREEVILLLLDSVGTPVSNFIQFLFGFPLTSKWSHDFRLQHSGVGGTSRSCLHVIQERLSQMNSEGTRLDVFEMAPKFAALSMRLLYGVCQWRSGIDGVGGTRCSFSRPLLHFLRQFILDQLNIVPIKLTEYPESSQRWISEYQSYLLRTASLSLHQLTQEKQQTDLARFINVLIGIDFSVKFVRDSHSEENTAFSLSGAGSNTSKAPLLTSISSHQLTSSRNDYDLVDNSTGLNRLLIILNQLELCQDYPVIKDEHLTNEEEIKEHISKFEYETTTDGGGGPGLGAVSSRRVNVRALHESLIDMSVQGPVEAKFVDFILDSAVQRNQAYIDLDSKVLSVDSWRDMTEAACLSYLRLPPVVNNPQTQQLLFELTFRLLQRLLEEDTVRTIVERCASTVLALIVTIQSSSSTSASHSSTFALDSDGGGDSFSVLDQSVMSFMSPAFQKKSCQMLACLLDLITKTDSSSHARSCLYAAINYFITSRVPPSLSSGGAGSHHRHAAGGQDINGGGGVIKREPSFRSSTSYNVGDAHVESRQSKLSRDIMDVIENQGGGGGAGRGGSLFRNLLSKDSVVGDGICRVLSLSLMDTIFSIQSQTSSSSSSSFLHFLLTTGHLKVIVDSLLHENNHLLSIISHNDSDPTTSAPPNMRPFFIYKAKMGLLSRIASSGAAGANALLQLNIFERLNECTFLDSLPPNTSYAARQGFPIPKYEEFAPSVEDRFYQLLFPCIRLISALNSSLGFNHREVQNQTRQFLLVHFNLVMFAVRERPTAPAAATGGHGTWSGHLDLPECQFLILITSLMKPIFISDMSILNGTSSFSDGANRSGSAELRHKITLLQRSLQILLVNVSPSDTLTKRINTQIEASSPALQRDSTHLKLKMTTLLTKIIANIFAIFVNQLRSEVASLELCCVIFSPSLKLAYSRDIGAYATGAVVTKDRPVGLGLLVYLINQLTAKFSLLFDEMKRHRNLIHPHFSTSSGETAAAGGDHHQPPLNLSPDIIAEFCGDYALSGGDSSSKMRSEEEKQEITRHLILQRIHQELRLLHLYFYVIEKSLFVLWRHVDFYVMRCSPVSRNEMVGATSWLQPDPTHHSPATAALHPQAQVRRLNGGGTRRVAASGGGPPHSFDEAEERDRVREAMLAQSGITNQDLDSITTELSKSLNDSFFSKIMRIDKIWKEESNCGAFNEILIRRLERIVLKCNSNR